MTRFKKYIVFQFDTYYPGGGLSDITGSFDTLDETKNFCVKNREDYNYVVDRDTWRKVWELD